MKSLPSKNLLRAFMDYDPKTGSLKWRKRDTAHFKTEGHCERWNNRYAGKNAGAYFNNGYLRVSIFKEEYAVHRIIWKIMTGDDPSHDIDHINGNRSDNRWSNLRGVTRAENMKNATLAKNNTSGVIGVGWHKAAKKWRAYIKTENTDKHLGLFEDFEAAVAARKAAELKYGFHENHGKRGE